MATIISKKNPKGKTYYTAQARVTENKVTVYRKAKNFPTKQDAKDWGAKKEAWARANRPWDLTPTNGVLYRDATERSACSERSQRHRDPRNAEARNGLQTPHRVRLPAWWSRCRSVLR